METHTDHRPGGIIPFHPRDLTEAEIVAFFREQATRLFIETGITYTNISLAVYNPGALPDQTVTKEVEWKTYVAGGNHETGMTLEEAFRKNALRFAPVDPTELRKKGQAMIAAADAAELRRAAK